MSLSTGSPIYTRTEWYAFCLEVQNKYPPLIPIRYQHITLLSELSNVPVQDVVQAISNLFLSICGDGLNTVETLRVQVSCNVFNQIESQLVFHREICKGFTEGDIHFIFIEGKLVIERLDIGKEDHVSKKKYPHLYRWYYNPSRKDPVSREARLKNKIRSSLSYLLYPEYQTLGWKEIFPFKNDVFFFRQKVREGTVHLYLFLENPRQYTAITDINQIAQIQIEMLSAILKGYLHKQYSLLDAMDAWSLLSIDNRRKIDALWNFIPSLELFRLAEIPEETQEEGLVEKQELTLDYFNPNDSFQNFIIELSLSFLQEHFEQTRGWYPFDKSILFQMLKSEEIRPDVMAYLINKEELLLDDLPPVEPSRSHPVFGDHQLFLQLVPNKDAHVVIHGAKARYREAKSEKKAVCNSENEDYAQADCHFYKMIQRRDRSLTYPLIQKSILRKDFMTAYELISAYKTLIRPENEFFLFLKVLLEPQEVNRVFIEVTIFTKESNLGQMSEIFIALLKSSVSSNFIRKLKVLMQLDFVQLNVEQVVNLIDLYSESDLSEVTKLYEQFQKSLNIFLGEISEELVRFIKKKSYTYLQVFIKKESLLSEKIIEEEVCSYYQFLDQISFTHLSSNQKIELWVTWLQNYGFSENAIKQVGLYLITLKRYLGFPLLQEDSNVLLMAHPSCEQWTEVIKKLEIIKEQFLFRIVSCEEGDKSEWEHFAMDPRLYKAKEELIKLLIEAPEIDPSLRDKYEDSIASITVRIEGYCRIDLLSTYQHLYDNFHVKSFRNGNASFSITLEDTTDVQYNHSGRIFPVLPGISMMTGWMSLKRNPLSLEESNPDLMALYLREVEGEEVQARVLIERLNFPTQMDIQTAKATRTKIQKKPELVPEDPLLLHRYPEIIHKRSDFIPLIPQVLENCPTIIKLVFKRLEENFSIQTQCLEFIRKKEELINKGDGTTKLNSELIKKMAKIIEAYPFLMKEIVVKYEPLIPRVLEGQPEIMELVFQHLEENFNLQSQSLELFKRKDELINKIGGAVKPHPELIQMMAKIIEINPFLMKEEVGQFEPLFLVNLKNVAEKVLLEGSADKRILILNSENILTAYPQDLDSIDNSMVYWNSVVEAQLEELKKNGLYNGNTKVDHIALNFLNNLKIRSREYWRQIVQGDISSSIRESKCAVELVSKGIIVSQEKFSQEIFYDEKKNKRSYKRRVLSFVPKGSRVKEDTGLTSHEILPGVIQNAYDLIKQGTKLTPLGSQIGTSISMKVRLLDSRGTYQSGGLMISSEPCIDEGSYKVILGVKFKEKRIYTMQPFIYSQERLNNPQNFSNFLSVQLMLLKMLYCRNSGK